MEDTNIHSQLIFDLARGVHLAARHNQDFERCEADLCCRARAALEIKGYGHRWDVGYAAAVATTEEQS